MDRDRPAPPNGDAPGLTALDRNSERAALLREAVLDSLAPPPIDDREGQIVESYAQTFDWIFVPGRHGFASWLAGKGESAPDGGGGQGRGRAGGGDGIAGLAGDRQVGTAGTGTGVAAEEGGLFWIHGSPGSGKSTLMRHIHQNAATRRLLNTWTAGRPLVVASFFFWESGTVMQRSRLGLLRSLVHQILSRQPRLLPDTMPTLWSHLYGASTLDRVRALSNWDEGVLEDALLNYFTLKERHYVYLHVDGLDELEGDQASLVRLFRRIERCGRVRICVSSRPWTVFNEMLEDVPSLRLQDLTEGDMRRFIRGRLRSSARIARLMKDDGAVEERLVGELLRKAGGVFLWVSLATVELARDLEGTTDMDELTKRLERLPAGLDNFYRHRLLKSSPLTGEMSRVFQLLRAREVVAAFTRDNDTSVTTLWEIVLARAEYSSAEVSETDILHLPEHEVQESCDEATKIIEDATSSLVKVQPNGQLPVTHRGVVYIHRTVKDWLAAETTWGEIVRLAPETSPHLAHLRSVVLSFKRCTEKPHRTRNVMAWWSRIVLAMTHARHVHPSLAEDMAVLLDTLNETLTWYYHLARDKDRRVDCWARTCFGTLEERGRTPYEEPFLALAIKFGVREYVRAYLDDGEGYEERGGKSLLEWSTVYLINRQQSLFPLSDPEIVGMLLEYGLDPNHRVTEVAGIGLKAKKVAKTPWERTLESVQQGMRRGWIEEPKLDTGLSTLADVIPKGGASQLEIGHSTNGGADAIKRAGEAGNSGMERWTQIIRMFVKYGADPRAEACASYKDRKESAGALLARVGKAFPSEMLTEVCEEISAKTR